MHSALSLRDPLLGWPEGLHEQLKRSLDPLGKIDRHDPDRIFMLSSGDRRRLSSLQPYLGLPRYVGSVKACPSSLR